MFKLKPIKMKHPTRDKSFAFAVLIVETYKVLISEKREFVLSKQLLRSGTAIGALVMEGEHGQSKRDFLSKMNIALKEANETRYWLTLLTDTDYLAQDRFQLLNGLCIELLKLLSSTVKTTKEALEREGK